MNPPDPHLGYVRVPQPGASQTAMPDGPIFCLKDDTVFVHQNQNEEHNDNDADTGVTLPRLHQVSTLLTGDQAAQTSSVSINGPLHQIANYRDEPVYALGLKGAPESSAGPLVPIGYRQLHGQISDTQLALLARAIQILAWDESTGFCSRCGTATEPAISEAVKSCPACGLTQYPRQAPAMIVGVVKDGRLLLAQSPRFKGAFHSILAGFVEPGETLEECVHREVFEEVGIAVKNIRYFGSQSWPFPHSLMVGFLADWQSGEITPDPEEISEADWYLPNEMPAVPGEISISGRIINWFRDEYGS